MRKLSSLGCSLSVSLGRIFRGISLKHRHSLPKDHCSFNRSSLIPSIRGGVWGPSSAPYGLHPLYLLLPDDLQLGHSRISTLRLQNKYEAGTRLPPQLTFGRLMPHVHHSIHLPYSPPSFVLFILTEVGRTSSSVCRT